MQQFCFVFLCSFLIWRCTVEPKAPQSFLLDAYIRYDALTNEGYAQATFKALPLRPDAGAILPGGEVTFQQRKMTVANTEKPVYRTKFHEMADSFQIFWRDSAATHQIDLKIPMPRIDSFWFEAKSVSISTPARLHWTGGDLKKGETLVLMWQNQEGKTSTTEVYNPSGMPFLELPAAKLKELSPGKWDLYLVRKHLTKTRLSKTGKRIVEGEQTAVAVESEAITEYYTRPRSFEVTR